MKRLSTFGLLILILVIAGFSFSSYATQIKKTTKKSVKVKAVSPTKPSTKAKKPLKLKPNLVVEALRLKGGVITFTLKNRGPGFLSDDDHKNGTVTISYKGYKKSYHLKTIDPTGELKKPGGSVPLPPTGKMLTSRQDVKVMVVYGKNKKHILTRTLGKIPPKRIAKPSKKPKHKVITKAPLHMENAGKAVSVKVKRTPKAEPFVSIPQVVIKNGTLHLTLTNKGKGKLSHTDYLHGTVGLTIGGKTRSWSLRTIDQKGSLGKRNKTVVFDTRIPMTHNQHVIVSMKKVKGEKMKVVRLGPVKKSLTPVAGVKRPQESMKPVPMGLPTAKRVGPLHKDINTVHPQFEQQTLDPSLLTTLDFQIGNYALSVKYHHHRYGHGFINIWYDTNDLGIYNGPVEFRIRVYNSSIGLDINETFVDQSNADGYASFPFHWLHEYGMILYYQVEVNPNHTIPETIYGNNHKNGQLYINNGPVKFMSEYMHFPGTSLNPLPDGIIRDFSESNVIYQIEHGSWWYHDPYDPGCNVIMMNIKVWVGNPTCHEKTLPLHLSFDSYDGARNATYDVTLPPGRDEWVTMGVMLNLQPENHIQVYFHEEAYPHTVHHIRINFRFNGLSYDLE